MQRFRTKSTKRLKRTRNRAHPLVPKDAKYDNTKFWIEYGIDLENRRVMLDEDVDEYSVGWIIRGIKKMVDIDDVKPIDVYINSYGGSIYDGLALYDELEALHYLTVRTHASGKIMSMAFILFMVGDERYCRPRATFMHHEGYDSIEGRRTHILNEAEELKRIDKICREIVAEKCPKKTLTWWREHEKYVNRYYDYKKAKQLGIVTHDYHNPLAEEEE